jgi:hypothetical protein
MAQHHIARVVLYKRAGVNTVRVREKIQFFAARAARAFAAMLWCEMLPRHEADFLFLCLPPWVAAGGE